MIPHDPMTPSGLSLGFLSVKGKPLPIFPILCSDLFSYMTVFLCMKNLIAYKNYAITDLKFVLVYFLGMSILTFR